MCHNLRSVKDSTRKLWERQDAHDGDRARLFHAVAAHIDNVVGAVGEMLESGAASLDKIELHGPASEWPDCKEQCDSLGMVYWDTAGTFSKFRMP